MLNYIEHLNSISKKWLDDNSSIASAIISYAAKVDSKSFICKAPNNVLPCRHYFNGGCQYNNHCNFKVEDEKIHFYNRRKY